MMGDSSRKISGSQIFVGILAIVAILWFGGCADSFADNPTSQQSQAILDNLGKIEITPEPNIAMPEVYSQPPKIVEQLVNGKAEWKLFYFCKYHTSDQLRQIIHDQFATKIFDQKGKDTTLPDYTVSSNAATNQLIVRCPAREDIEAVLVTLEEVDVPPVQVKIDCLVSEVYADKTLDNSTTLMVRELFGEGIWAGPAGLPFGMDVADLLEEAATLPAFPGASLRELTRARMGLQVGYATEKYLALVDILESQGYLKILMNPTLEVVNGKKATVIKSEHVPLQTVTKYIPIKSGGSDYSPQTEIEYIDVIDSLEIIPHVFEDGAVGLETSIILGSKLTPEGVKQLPIVSKKEIKNQENRIRRGESLIIGGIRKSEKRDVIRGIPFFKDLPVVGILFSGRDFEERVIETMFVLTPTISTGGVPKQAMVEEVGRIHEPPVPEGLYEKITDPFGSKARQRELQRKNEQADQLRFEAEAEKAEARDAARQATEKLKKAEAEVERLKTKLEEAQAEAERAEKEAQQAKEKAEKPSARDPQAKANPGANNPKSEANKPKPEAEQPKPEQEQAQSGKSEAE